MSSQADVLVIGAGIAGLAHAWSALERGHRVTLLERSARACGGSIRNFGMIWPIGQPAGALRQTALQSRQRWLNLAKSAGIWVQTCGSIHLAHRDDEMAVLEEFCRQSHADDAECSLLTASEVVSRTPAANPDGLRGGMFNPAELCVNPRRAIARLPHWLTDEYGLRCEFDTPVVRVESGEAFSADGRHWSADRIVICSGADFKSLLPESFHRSGLQRCKLQMLKTVAQPDGWRIGPHLASGLTIRHYRNFEHCPSLPALQRRIASETPELDRFGIHVMASQNEAGEVILGDSHEYDASIEPFDKPAIDALIVSELRKVISLPDWTIAERWHGVYAKLPTGPCFEAEPLPGVHIFTGLGGAGMTMSFGLAEQFWQRRQSQASN